MNIALQMLDDAYQGLAERMILVSGDSDLVPAISFVKQRSPDCQVLVYIPKNHLRRGAAVELTAVADRIRNLPPVELAKAQFPRYVKGPSGAVYERPANW